MHQSKNPKTESGEELVQDPMDPETVPEAGDPSEKKDPTLDPPKAHPMVWEYHRMIVRDTAARIPLDDLNKLGRQGWELVAIFHLHADINFVFKRFKV